MGYSHFNAISVTGSGGFAVGSRTAGESVVISTAGDLTLAGAITATGEVTASGVNLNNENATIVTTLTWASTATQSWYVCAPVAGNITKGYLVHPVAAATSNAVAVLHGTAGAGILSFAVTAGTIGTITAASATGTVAVTQGELLKVTMTASNTSIDQKYQTLCIILDRT